MERNHHILKIINDVELFMVIRLRAQYIIVSFNTIVDLDHKLNILCDNEKYTNTQNPKNLGLGLGLQRAMKIAQNADGPRFFF